MNQSKFIFNVSLCVFTSLSAMEWNDSQISIASNGSAEAEGPIFTPTIIESYTNESDYLLRSLTKRNKLPRSDRKFNHASKAVDMIKKNKGGALFDSDLHITNIKKTSGSPKGPIIDQEHPTLDTSSLFCHEVICFKDIEKQDDIAHHASDAIERKKMIAKISSQSGVWIGDQERDYLFEKTKNDSIDTLSAFMKMISQEALARKEVVVTQEFCRQACLEKEKTEIVIVNVQNQIVKAQDTLATIQKDNESNHECLNQIADTMKKDKEEMKQMIRLFAKMGIGTVGAVGVGFGVASKIGFDKFQISSETMAEMRTKLFELSMDNKELREQFVALASAATKEAAKASMEKISVILGGTAAVATSIVVANGGCTVI